MSSLSIERLKKLGELERWSNHQIVSRYFLYDESQSNSDSSEILPSVHEASIHWLKDDALILVMVFVSPKDARVSFMVYESEAQFDYVFNVWTQANLLSTKVINNILDNLDLWLISQKDVLHTYKIRDIINIVLDKDMGELL